jgi:hypothetical protein
MGQNLQLNQVGRHFKAVLGPIKQYENGGLVATEIFIVTKSELGTLTKCREDTDQLKVENRNASVQETKRRNVASIDRLLR